MPRSPLPYAALGIAIVAMFGCGALVGVEKLEVVEKEDAIEDGGSPDRRAPPTPVEAGGDTGADVIVELPPPERPPVGTYTYKAIPGSGDQLKGTFGTGLAAYDTTMMTIEYVGEDCFNQKLHLRNNYDETFHLCRRDHDFVQDTGVRVQNVYVTVTTTQSCTPGDTYIRQLLPNPGDVVKHKCTGHNDESQSGDSNSNFETGGDYIFVGEEPVPVGGTNVMTRHYHDAREVTLSQQGTNVADWYFSPKSGVLVRLKRAIDIKYKFGAFTVNYVENVDMTITAPPPP